MISEQVTFTTSELVASMDSLVQKEPTVFNMKCPFCEANSKNNKKRGYLHSAGDELRYYCHKCHASYNYRNFLKQVDDMYGMDHYNTYITDYVENPVASLKSTSSSNYLFKRRAKLKDTHCFDLNHSSIPIDVFREHLPTISECGESHIAYKYLESRNIPKNMFETMFYIDDMRRLSDIFPSVFDKDKFFNQQRLIIPFLNKHNRCIGMQCRLLGSGTLKYMTLPIVDSGSAFLYGVDKLDKTKPVYLVEGPIDSMFLENAVATAGLSKMRKTLTELMRYGIKNIIYIPDNEPDSPDTTKSLQYAIDFGFNVFIWGSSVTDCKDINDLVMKLGSIEQARQYVIDHTYSSVFAKEIFNKWKNNNK